MQKIWLKNYPAGVPAEINPDEYSSLQQLIGDACEQFAALPAYTSMGTTLTYGEYREQARDFAAWLQQSAGLRKGDRIAIMLPNVLQYPIALYGALLAGLTLVNTNPLYTARELEHQLVDSGAKAILILENFAHTLEEVIGKTNIETVITTQVGDRLRWPKSSIVNLVVKHVRKQVPRWRLPGAITFNAALSQGNYLPLTPVPLDHTDIAFLQYTGGTTGVSKGAMLTHRNMVANVLQSAAWIGSEAQLGKDTIITALPLYHIFALTANWMVFVKFGARSILIANPRDFPAFVAELKKFRFTYFSGVNTLFNALLNTPGFAEVDFSGLRITLGGGMAVQRSVAEQWKKVTGNVLTQAWGLTETSPAACINPFGLDFNGSIGLPIPSTEISIRDDAGQEQPIGEIGEICVRGPQVMRGYWNRPDETAKVMLDGGWLRTGDIGRMDDEGFVFIEDRKKDMILVSGFNVYPNEVESVIAAHPGVLEVAAVAQPDEHSGEVVALFVVRKDPSLTEHALIEFARNELTGYKRPKHVYFRNELPKTNVGKILRRALRDQLPKG
ncbi:MAG TPA: AMP-binding protein [Povalibacter sp.]|uniref:AMP-binding protein n=1 Tax=Povalibacter sp. TaxID=1962978 RepID=UPI002D0D1F2E|nr:AMP-binding protein [Povalibacter sp.]HMN45842.1 AMP-binding protein [Povalibacter sp.]